MDYKVLDEALAYLNNESYSDKCIYESLQDEFNLDLLLAVEEENLLSEMSGLILESESKVIAIFAAVLAALILPVIVESTKFIVKAE